MLGDEYYFSLSIFSVIHHFVKIYSSVFQCILIYTLSICRIMDLSVSSLYMYKPREDTKIHHHVRVFNLIFGCIPTRTKSPYSYCLNTRLQTSNLYTSVSWELHLYTLLHMEFEVSDQQQVWNKNQKRREEANRWVFLRVQKENALRYQHNKHHNQQQLMLSKVDPFHCLDK